jgi:hypothetical protein
MSPGNEYAKEPGILFVQAGGAPRPSGVFEGLGMIWCRGMGYVEDFEEIWMIG